MKSFRRYGVACLITAAAIAVRWTYIRFIGPETPFIPFLAACLVTFWLAGLGPAIFTCVLGGAAARILFLSDWMPARFIGYFSLCALALWFFEVLQRSRRQAEASARLAEARQRDLTDAQASLERTVERRTADLAHSRRLLAEAQVLAHVGSWDWEAGSDRIAASEELCRIFGVSTNAPYPEYLRRVHRQDRAKVRSAVAHVLESLEDAQLACRIVGREGQVRFVHARAHVVAEEGRLVRIFGTVQDVTERRQAEFRFEQLLDSAPVAFVIVNNSGRIVLVNSETERLFGYHREELLDRNVEMLVPEGFRAMHAAHRRFYVSDPRRRTMGDGFDIDARRKDGSTFPVEVTVGPLDLGGSVVISAAIRDVTERHRAEEHIRALNEDLERRVAERTRELERSNEELQEFAYIISHDLQEPLRSISSFGQLLENRHGVTLEAEAKEFLEYITDAAGRMKRLIDTLLLYSRSGAPNQPMEAVDCEAAIEHALADLRAAIEESGAEVIREPLPVIRARPLQIAQVFQNLIGNAVKYRSPERPPVVRISAKHHGREWVFSVADNGIGIEPRYFDRIFLPFRRLHGDRYEGTGIGLAIVKKIVGRHGGRAWAEPNQPHGSIFHFTIPAG